MPQGKIHDKVIARSARARDAYVLVIERADGTFFRRQVTRSTYSKKKIGGAWQYFERKVK
jgi:hypothetical protein